MDICQMMDVIKMNDVGVSCINLFNIKFCYVDSWKVQQQNDAEET